MGMIVRVDDDTQLLVEQSWDSGTFQHFETRLYTNSDRYFTVSLSELMSKDQINRIQDKLTVAILSEISGDSEPSNMIELTPSYYIVRTQAGFRKACKRYIQDRDHMHLKDLRGYPTSYPSLVCFSDGYEGYEYPVADCIHLNTLLKAIGA